MDLITTEGYLYHPVGSPVLPEEAWFLGLRRAGIRFHLVCHFYNYYLWFCCLFTSKSWIGDESSNFCYKFSGCKFWQINNLRWHSFLTPVNLSQQQWEFDSILFAIISWKVSIRYSRHAFHCYWSHFPYGTPFLMLARHYSISSNSHGLL